MHETRSILPNPNKVDTDNCNYLFFTSARVRGQRNVSSKATTISAFDKNFYSIVRDTDYKKKLMIDFITDCGISHALMSVCDTVVGNEICN